MGVALARSCVVLVVAATGACAAGGDSQDGDDGTRSEAPADLGAARALDADASVVFFPRLGNLQDDPSGSLGPGALLMGSDMRPASAIAWAHDTVAHDRLRVAGDVVVLCDHGDDQFGAALYQAAPFNSVQTIRVPPGAAKEDIDLVARRLETAEIVFLADGSAATYARWRTTALGPAVRGVHGRGGVVAGGGAGARALASAMILAPDEWQSTAALADPYGGGMSVVAGPFAIGALAGTIVELDLRARDRFGRLAAGAARALGDDVGAARPNTITGFGLDAGVALAIDRSLTAVLLADAASIHEAWAIRGGRAQELAPGRALQWAGLVATRFDAIGESLNVARGCGTAFSYRVTINGGESPPFTPSDPYVAQGASSPCY